MPPTQHAGCCWLDGSQHVQGENRQNSSARKQNHPQRVEELERIFDRRTNVSIDFANMKPWATNLGWHVDVKRLKQFLDSFDTINSITVSGNAHG
jgi:Ca2+-binding EF-hand superfamily protein